MSDIHKATVMRGDKYLLLQNGEGGAWGFPGGKLNEGEDPQSGIERLSLEQSNQTVRAKDVQGTYEINGRSYVIHATQSFFGDVRMGKGFTGYRWMTRDEILDLNKVEPYIIKYFEEHPE